MPVGPALVRELGIWMVRVVVALEDRCNVRLRVYGARILSRCIRWRA